MNMWTEDSNQKMLSREESLALRVAELEVAMQKVKEETYCDGSARDAVLYIRDIAEKVLKS